MTTTLNPSFRPLGSTYGKNGFHYELVVRDGDIAIFKQRLRPGVGCLAYEVIRIKSLGESTMFGKVVPAREAAPSNEDFGFSAWSYSDLVRAKAKMRALIETRDNDGE